MENKTYRIVRFYQNDRNRRVQARGLTLKQAQEWCNDPETSSHTARRPKGCDGNDAMIDRWSDKQKHWFDGFESEA